jgi:hypothetical protein
MSVTVTPWATEGDAEAVLANGPKNVTPNPRSTVKVTDQRTVEGIKVVGSPVTWAYEIDTVGSRGDGKTRYLQGTNRYVGFGVTVSDLTGRWTWDEVASVAELITFRISQMSESI